MRYIRLSAVLLLLACGDGGTTPTSPPLIVAPFWSLTVAVSCAVVPRAFNQTLFGNTVIEVATGAAGVGGLVGVVPPSPHAASKSTAESRT